MGIASNHADVTHWLPLHGKTMDDFRAEVQRVLSVKSNDNTPDNYAAEAVNWALSNNILRGNDKGNLHLHDNCTRQDMLVFIHKALLK